MRGERLARLHDVKHAETFIRLQDVLPGRIQLGILAFAARQSAPLGRHFAIQARTLRFQSLARGSQLLAGLAVLRQAGGCLLRGGRAALLLLAQLFPLRALVRQLRLAARQLLFQAIAGRFGRNGHRLRGRHALGFEHFQFAARLLQLRRHVTQLGPQAIFHALPLLRLRLGRAGSQQAQ
ncbi:hypothetical protein D3C72_1492860 [compost metagenome]